MRSVASPDRLLVKYVVRRLRRLKRRVLRRPDGEKILRRRFATVHGRPLDVNHPRTFTEKLFRRMIDLNRRNDPRMTRLADKFTARSHVAHAIGERYLVELLWHGTDAARIPFDRLPSAYVVKPSHSSGRILRVTGPVDRAGVIARAEAWLRVNHYWTLREFQYYPIRPRILVEELLQNRDGSPILDYRFWCFGGRPELVQVDNHEHDVNSFYDLDWNLLDLHYRDDAARPEFPRPAGLEEMRGLAARLAAGFDFVRVDLYHVDGRIRFGELTFTPTAGLMKLRPERWDERLGAMWAYRRR
jgi:hypothetical protein